MAIAGNQLSESIWNAFSSSVYEMSRNSTSHRIVPRGISMCPWASNIEDLLLLVVQSDLRDEQIWGNEDRHYLLLLLCVPFTSTHYIWRTLWDCCADMTDFHPSGMYTEHTQLSRESPTVSSNKSWQQWDRTDVQPLTPVLVRMDYSWCGIKD